MNPQKQSVQNAQALSLNLSQKDEIDQKTDYYKSLIKTYSDLVESIDKKVETETDEYTKNKLIIEKVETENKIFSMKGFFEMWLERSRDYDSKFAMITKECNDKFDETFEKFKEISKLNILLSSWLQKYESEPDKNQRIKNEFYALIKFEVMKATNSKEAFNVGAEKK
ncbi:MAG: hypothetical protein IPJ01_11600 [Micavibrio sp.]|nr:hypothetical protein [Micavibrio sp.]